MGSVVNRPCNALIFCTGMLCMGAETQDSLALITDSGDRQAIQGLVESFKIDAADIEVRECVGMLPAGVDVPEVAHYKVFRVCVGDGQVRGLFMQKYKIGSMEKVAGLVHLRELHLVNVGLTGIEGLDHLAHLEILDLVGNEIGVIEGLEGLSSLRKLILCRNSIKSIEGLEGLSGLRYLNLDGNKIKTIGGLEGLSGLRYLSLDGNRIKTIGGLKGLSSLRKLYLGGNKIKKIEGLCSLGGLVVLALHDNKIGKIENLGCLTSLRELYLSSNKLKSCQGLGEAGTLGIVDLGSNTIMGLEGLEGLGQLEVLDLSDNKIEKASASIESLFGKYGVLRSVALYENPLGKDEKSALAKLGKPGLVSCKPGYKVTCKKWVKVPGGKSYGYYMGKAREFHEQDQCGKACSYYSKAAQEYGPWPYNDVGKPEAVEAAIATAFCTLEVYKNSAAATKMFLLGGLDEEQAALVRMGLAEANRRRGKLKTAAGMYGAYLEEFPDGAHAELARYYQGEIERYLQTHDVKKASNARIKQPVQLIFFELKRDENGNLYL